MQKTQKEVTPLKDLEIQVHQAKDACHETARASTASKNAVLESMARLLEKKRSEVLSANRKDLDRSRAHGLNDNMMRRLLFDDQKIEGCILALRRIADLPDPVGQLEQFSLRPNGLQVARMRIPIGVLLMIYESRPHVTLNAGAFAIKSGNTLLLKGGSEARECNALLGEFWKISLQAAGLPENAIQVISGNHEQIAHLLGLSHLIDLVIPRGGKGLIEGIVKQSRIPVIKHYQGICHVYVGADSDTSMAQHIVLDSKLLMPEVCNAAECVLLDTRAPQKAQTLVKALIQNGVEVRGCSSLVEMCQGVIQATEKDFETEHLDLVISAKMVAGLDEAIAHIHKYGSGHTESIVTGRYDHAQRFLREVDSSVVLVNASTMFCDGNSLGMGAEIGISTDRLHARGPMGLRELTTYKFVIQGDGQIMGTR